MDDSIINTPKFYTEIEVRTKEIGFSMPSESRITSVDNDPELSEIALNYFGDDERVNIGCAD